MNRVRNAATYLATLTILAVSAFCVAQPPPGGSADLDAIRRAWKAREERCDKVRLVWTATEVTPKGYYSKVDELKAGKAKAKGGPDSPLKDTVATKTATLLLSGVKLRYQARGGMFSTVNGPAEPTNDEYLSAFDSKLNQRYFPPGTRIEGSATLEEGKYSDEVRTISMAALLRHFRGHSLAEPTGLLNLVVTPKRGDFNGRACIILTAPRGQGQLTYEYWVDPSRDYAIVRHVAMRGDALVSQTDCDYRLDDKVGWLPDHWTTTHGLGGVVQPKGGQSKATSCQVNPPIDDGEFKLVFAAGTRVFDRRDNKEYIVMPDGTLRLIR